MKIVVIRCFDVGFIKISLSFSIGLLLIANERIRIVLYQSILDANSYLANQEKK